MIGNFASKETSFKANLKDGRSVELTLRPYSLADMAWSQETFKTEEDQIAIANMKVEPCAKLIWNQLKAEDKKIFMAMNFVKTDDEGNDIEVKPEGYERFIEGIIDVESLIAGYISYAKNMEINGFLPDSDKKKTMKM